MFDGNSLVRVELLDAARPEGVAEPVINARGKGGVVRGPGLEGADGRDPAVRRVPPLGQTSCQAVEDRLQRDVVCRIGPLCQQHDRTMIRRKDHPFNQFSGIPPVSISCLKQRRSSRICVQAGPSDPSAEFM